MRMYDIIEAKKKGEELTKEQIDWFVSAYTKGDVPDYQVSALLMAICFVGCTPRETTDLTLAMMNSGELADLFELGSSTVDKHSTGGVGDKTTLIVAPIAASLGCKIAKMSGRGLGHTGGTVDKLEAIDGYNTSLSAAEFLNQVKRVGIAVVGQTGNFAPADKKLYALRDVTATVNSIPLIASSIMSKKLAAGSNNIVLDVKYGNGAFMPDSESAKKLAREMVNIGNSVGKKTAALITNMEAPLGYTVGNSLEVGEAVELLRGGDIPDLYELCLNLSAQMVSLGLNIDFKSALCQCEEALKTGAAYKTFLDWISSQGGNVSEFDDLESFTRAEFTYGVTAENSGYISGIDAKTVGVASSLLGAGRTKKDSQIDLTAGIRLYKKCGDYVEKGETIAKLQSSTIKDFSVAEKILRGGYKYGNKKSLGSPIIFDIIK